MAQEWDVVMVMREGTGVWPRPGITLRMAPPWVLFVVLSAA